MLPPGPKAPAHVQALLFARDPLGVLRRCRARYGAAFTLRLAPRGPVVAIAGPPELVEELIRADPSCVHAGAARRAVLPQASPASSFGADEGRHRAARGRIEAPLSNPHITDDGALLESVVAAHVAAWPVLRPFRVLSRMRSLCEEAFVRVGLGIDSPDRAKELREALGRALRTPGNPPVLPRDRDEGLLGKGLHRVAERRLRPVKRLLVEEIERRRAHRDAGPDGIVARAAAEDSLRPEELADELIVVLAAAQEPPAIAATWLLERLGRTPGLGADYLAAGRGSERRRAILDETLRLRPPALASMRRLRRTVTTEGYELPAGTDVMVPIGLVHTEPSRFARPLEFNPERFADATRPPDFVPFGTGPRACPGEALARRELELVAEEVLTHVRLRFLGRPERPVQRATVLVPDRSGLAIARPRAGREPAARD